MKKMMAYRNIISIVLILLTLLQQINNQIMMDNSNTLVPINLQNKINKDPDIANFQLTILAKNQQFIDKHNMENNTGFQLKINQFALLSDQQIKRTLFSLIQSNDATINWALQFQKQPKVQGNEPGVAKQINITNQDPVILRLRDFLRRQGFTEKQIDVEVEKYSYTGRNNTNVSSSNSSSLSNSSISSNLSVVDIPANRRLLQQPDNSFWNVDWTCISGQVINQGNCGSCYIIATIDTLSMILGIHQYSFFVRLASQQILDCSRNTLTLGCHGGFIEGAISYLMKYGISIDYWYPYQGITQRKCKDIKSKKYIVKSFTQFINTGKQSRPNSCFLLRANLKDQPIVAGMVSNRKLLYYTKGIFDACQPDEFISHAIVVVGYNSQKGWRIKNSWGKGWGENGYAWIKDNDTCKICQMYFTLQADTSFQKQKQC